MEDKDIIKALECCSTEDFLDCSYCPYRDDTVKCHLKLMRDALDLIKRQQEEIEDLEILTGLMQKREYYNKFVKEVYQPERGNDLAYPDFDDIYKRYFEQQEKINSLVEQMAERCI